MGGGSCKAWVDTGGANGRLFSVFLIEICGVGGRVTPAPMGLRKNAERMAPSVCDETPGIYTMGVRLGARLRARLHN